MMAAQVVDGIGELKPTLAKILPSRLPKFATAKLRENVENEVKAGV